MEALADKVHKQGEHMLLMYRNGCVKCTYYSDVVECALLI